MPKLWLPVRASKLEEGPFCVVGPPEAAEGAGPCAMEKLGKRKDARITTGKIFPARVATANAKDPTRETEFLNIEILLSGNDFHGSSKFSF
jgi:hypothetical protein